VNKQKYFWDHILLHTVFLKGAKNGCKAQLWAVAIAIAFFYAIIISASHYLSA